MSLSEKVITLLISATIMIVIISVAVVTMPPLRSETLPPPQPVTHLVDASVCIGVEDRVYGSGTIIKSNPHVAYILTAAHVVGSRDEVHVKRPVYDNEQRTVFRDFLNYRAEVLKRDVEDDLALLRVTGTSLEFPAVTPSFGPGPSQGDESYTVGCPLGRNLYVSKGIVNAQRAEVWREETRYGSSTAQIVNGNSGGGTFWLNPETNRWELTGVLSTAAVMGTARSRQVVTHMGSTIRFDTIQRFIADNWFYLRG